MVTVGNFSEISKTLHCSGNDEGKSPNPRGGTLILYRRPHILFTDEITS